MFGFLSDLLFCSYDNGWTLNFDIKLLRTEKKSVNRHIFFLARNLTCSSLHQGRFGICHRRRTPGNTYIKLHIPASIFHRMPWKDCPPTFGCGSPSESLVSSDCWKTAPLLPLPCCSTWWKGWSATSGSQDLFLWKWWWSATRSSFWCRVDQRLDTSKMVMN